MRHILHPGPLASDRMQIANCTIRQVDVFLPPGLSLLNALTDVVASNGARSATGMLHGGRFEPFAYVMPALSTSPDHAVYFSDRHVAAAAVKLDMATVTVGQRDGQAWMHCHAAWTDHADRRHVGHVLPNEAIVAEPVAATLYLLDGAGFDVRPDAETGFNLFDLGPDVVPAGPAGHGMAPPAFALRVRPNEDICTAVESACAARGIAHALVRGGVGSLVGAVFEDGRSVEPFVTEVLIRGGEVVVADPSGRLEARLDVTVVDYLGGIAEGRLQRGANAVLVTFELLVEAVNASESPVSAGLVPESLLNA